MGPIPRIRFVTWTTGKSLWKCGIPRRARSPKRTTATTSSPGRDTVRDFYRLNHRHQTYDFVRQKKHGFPPLRPTADDACWRPWTFLDTLVDDSDPDIDLSQREHLLQTAEAIRADGHEDWFVLTGLIHDLGKVLCLFGEPQWAVVGDTFPVGCAFSDRIVYPEFFADNPDTRDSELQSPCGVYDEAAGYETSTCPGDTTSTCTTSSRIACRSRRCT